MKILNSWLNDFGAFGNDSEKLAAAMVDLVSKPPGRPSTEELLISGHRRLKMLGTCIDEAIDRACLKFNINETDSREQR